jgi:hypothetical protein
VGPASGRCRAGAYHRCTARTMAPGSAPLSDHPKTVNLCEEPVVAVLNGWIGQLFDWRNIDVTVAAPVDSQSGQRDSGGRKRQAGDVGRRGPNHAARPAPPMRLAASTVGLALAAAEPAAGPCSSARRCWRSASRSSLRRCSRRYSLWYQPQTEEVPQDRQCLHRPWPRRWPHIARTRRSGERDSHGVPCRSHSDGRWCSAAAVPPSSAVTAACGAVSLIHPRSTRRLVCAARSTISTLHYGQTTCKQR